MRATELVHRREENSNRLRRLPCLFRVGEFALGVFRAIAEALTVGPHSFFLEFGHRDSERELSAYGFVAHENDDAESYEEGKDLYASGIGEEL